MNFTIVAKPKTASLKSIIFVKLFTIFMLDTGDAKIKNISIIKVQNSVTSTLGTDEGYENGYDYDQEISFVAISSIPSFLTNIFQSLVRAWQNNGVSIYRKVEKHNYMKHTTSIYFQHARLYFCFIA